jgi:hypothetical protein
MESVMMGNPSLMTRLAIGKGIGFVIGLIGMLTLPSMMPEIGTMARWGFLFWYITFGAIIGIFGVFTLHPILRLPLPWWFMSPFVGAWLNFVLTLFIYDMLAAGMLSFFGPNGALSSPFWLVAEGAVVGLLIGYFATRFGGEGPETAVR